MLRFKVITLDWRVGLSLYLPPRYLGGNRGSGEQNCLARTRVARIRNFLHEGYGNPLEMNLVSWRKKILELQEYTCANLLYDENSCWNSVIFC